jgi:hypothetical protein
LVVKRWTAPDLDVGSKYDTGRSAGVNVVLLTA